MPIVRPVRRDRLRPDDGVGCGAIARRAALSGVEWRMLLSPQQEQDLKPVIYEWQMLLGAAAKLGAPEVSGDEILKNLVLEAFVVHFRQLAFFFFGNRHKDDLHVTQFVGGESWKKLTRRRNPWQDEIDRASRQVAHLTAERHFKPNEQQKQEWPVARLVKEVDEELKVFSDLTGFAGFQRVVLATGRLTIDTGNGLLMPVDSIVASATNAPMACNSVTITSAPKTIG
jgi:hypothetical protein